MVGGTDDRAGIWRFWTEVEVRGDATVGIQRVADETVGRWRGGVRAAG